MKIKELYEQVRDGRIISDIGLQREIIYSHDKQVLVIDSLVKDIPLPAFYFWRNNDEVLEVLDGKQRIEAIRNFYENNIEYEGKVWKGYDEVFQNKINDTEIREIICEGTNELKREIFNRINTLGVPLSRFEVLNGLYNGEYLRSLTRYAREAKEVINLLGPNNRGNSQWWILNKIIGLKSEKNINDYVEKNKDTSFDSDSKLIAKYLKFINSVFEKPKEKDIYFALAVKYEKDIAIWKQHKNEINKQISEYLKDKVRVALTDKATEIEDIIQAVVSNISVDPKRLFTSDDKVRFLQNQNPINNKYQCAICGQYFFDNELTMDHIKAWSKSGRTELSNAQLSCRACNSSKGNR